MFDTEGREYKKTLMTYTTGVKPGESPNSKYILYFKEGATFTFFHALPINAKPSFLKFSYSWVKSLKESEKKEGEIEINISKTK